jgi:hypothetical protein
MIKKALFTTGILLMMHYLFIVMFPPSWETGQHLWQDNLIKAQEYLYQNKRADGVIVGSSLSARLDQAVLPQYTLNLAMGGLSIYDGIKVVLQKPSLPKYVCIETNLITRSASADFEKSLLSMVMHPLRSWWPILREKNQPIGILTGYILSKVSKPKSTKVKSSKSDADKADTDRVFAQMLEHAKSERQQPPDQELINKRIKELKEMVGELSVRGVKVYFYEMPVSQELCDYPYPRRIREMMDMHFPSSEYRYLPLPDCSRYNTTDGVHLDQKSATEYTAWLTKLLFQNLTLVQ